MVRYFACRIRVDLLTILLDFVLVLGLVSFEVALLRAICADRVGVGLILLLEDLDVRLQLLDCYLV